MVKKSNVVVKEVDEDISKKYPKEKNQDDFSQRSEQNESESEVESPVEKPKQKRHYEMTPARQEAIKKMIEARQKKAKEARVSKELNKIETVETKIKSKKEKLEKYKESDEYIPPKPKSKPKKKLVKVVS